eukprot:SAG31_NODE_1180_length_9525_cov_4.989497_7_plen_202_part_00
MIAAWWCGVDHEKAAPRNLGARGRELRSLCPVCRLLHRGVPGYLAPGYPGAGYGRTGTSTGTSMYGRTRRRAYVRTLARTCVHTGIRTGTPGTLVPARRRAPPRRARGRSYRIDYRIDYRIAYQIIRCSIKLNLDDDTSIFKNTAGIVRRRPRIDRSSNTSTKLKYVHRARRHARGAARSAVRMRKARRARAARYVGILST